MGEIADEMVNRMMGFGGRRGRTRPRHLDLVKVHFHRITRETDKALLMDIKGEGELWIPKSIIACKSAHTAMLHRDVYFHILADAEARGKLDELLPDLPEDD